jgi:hypothetical protein
MPLTSSDVMMQALRADASLQDSQQDSKCWSSKLNGALQQCWIRVTLLYKQIIQHLTISGSSQHGGVDGKVDGCSIPATHAALMLG